MRKWIRIGIAVLAVAVLGLLGMKSYDNATYFKPYHPELPLNPVVQATTEVNDSINLFGVDRARHYRRTEFTFEARPGEAVPCILTQPPDFNGKLPVIIFLHGSGQDKRFVEQICTPFNAAGFAMVSYDQFGRGGRKVEGWAAVTSWNDRGWKTVDDTRRLIDYLITRPDVDPARIYLVGASYGAMTGTHVLAFEKRIRAAALVVGGGNFKVMLDAPLIRENVPGIVLAILKPLSGFLGGPFDPVRSAPKVGPMPVLMQNGSDDKLVSPEAGKALYEALPEPKEILWYPVDHPGLRKGDGPEIVRMLDDGLRWMLAQDAPFRQQTAPQGETTASQGAQTLAPAA
jgi:poly(3-hydroxybutyrate) depolymerase